jgi:hypothetical protein
MSEPQIDGVNPKNFNPMLAGLVRHKEYLQEISSKNQNLFGVSATQLKAVSDSFQRTLAPFLKLAKNPRFRSELFMHRRKGIQDKFFKLVASPLELAVLELQVLFTFLNSTKNNFPEPRRAQIMSLRGLALSCAPNLTQKGDIKLLSRSKLGMRNSLVA